MMKLNFHNKSIFLDCFHGRFLRSIFDGFELHFLTIFTPQEKHQQTRRVKRFPNQTSFLAFAIASDTDDGGRVWIDF